MSSSRRLQTECGAAKSGSTAAAPVKIGPDCRSCAVYGYLETGRFSAPVPYLCQVTEETRRHKQEWPSRHRRYFEIAGITIRLESDLPMDQLPFAEALQPFEVQGPGSDMVTLRHVFELPDVAERDLGVPLYRKAPWTIYRKGDSFIYLGMSQDLEPAESNRVAVFDSDFGHGIIYSSPRQESTIRREGFPNLTLFPTDQILVAQLLAAAAWLLLACRRRHHGKPRASICRPFRGR